MRLIVSWSGAVAFLLLLAPAMAQTQKVQCVVGPDAVKPRMETHALAPYPVGSVGNNEQGTVLLEIRIAADGQPTTVRVKTSSGFPDLDETTRAWVQDHWKWQPLKENCIANIFVNYRWNLIHQLSPAL